MQMTRERKIYAVILGLAAGALALDQLVLRSGSSGPQAAAAAGAAAEASNAPAATGAQSGGAASPSSGAPTEAEQVLEQIDLAKTTLNDDNSLAHRLRSLAGELELTVPTGRNAFAPPADWTKPSPEPEGRESDPQQKADRPPPAARFRENHRLRAVMAAGANGIALLKSRNEPLRVGDALDGFTLTAVRSDAAVFRGPDGQRVTLKLSRSSP